MLGLGLPFERGEEHEGAALPTMTAIFAEPVRSPSTPNPWQGWALTPEVNPTKSAHSKAVASSELRTANFIGYPSVRLSRAATILQHEPAKTDSGVALQEPLGLISLCPFRCERHQKQKVPQLPTGCR